MINDSPTANVLSIGVNGIWTDRYRSYSLHGM